VFLGYIGLDDDLPCFWVISAVDKEALVFIPEIIAKYTFYPVALLCDHQLGEVVIVYTRQFHIGTAKPGPGGSLGAQAVCGYQAEYDQ